MKLHVIMPIGGKGQRFFDGGFVIPKPLIEINGKPFFYWSALSLKKFIPDSDIIFVVLKEHIDTYHIDEKIRQFFPEAKIAVIPQVLNGALFTCMEGAKTISDELPIIFNDCDHIFRCEQFNNTINNGTLSANGVLLTFKSNSPKYSYVQCRSDGTVACTKEKEVISSDAICGAYCFANKNIFLSCAEVYAALTNSGEYYMSGVYNIMAKQGLKAIVMNTDFHISFGTPEEYFIAKGSERFKELL